MALLKSVFTVGHLPGYIFITASPINIAAAQKKASTTKSQLPQPIPMQHDEWHGFLDALPWLNHYIPWAIIQDHPEQLEKGKLAVCVGFMPGDPTFHSRCRPRSTSFRQDA